MLAFGMSACSDYDGQTEHGYDYWHHIDIEGEKPAIGDEVYLYFRIRTQDTLLFASANSARGMRTVLQDHSLNPLKKPDPVADVLPLMSAGDSVTVVMEVSDDMREAAGLATADFLYYDVVVRKIIPAGHKDEYGAQDEYLKGEEEALLAKPDFRAAIDQDPEASKILSELVHFAENYQHLGTSTRSGLWYSMLEKGEDAKVRKGVGVKVKFLGYLNDGVVFGENFTGNAAFSFTAGQGSVIKAWE